MKIDIDMTPEEVLESIRNSSVPEMEAINFATTLLGLTEKDDPSFWNDAKLNLLTMILLLAAADEEITPERIVDELLPDNMTTHAIAESYIECNEQGDKYEKPIRRCFAAHYNSKQSEEIAASLAFDMNIRKYFLASKE